AGIRGASNELIIGNRRYLIGGDIITAVNGQPIIDWTDLSEYLELYTAVGDEISISLIREGRQYTTSLTLLGQP
ncbi:MAG: PDZ domain-containing protein, partial [Candidatus Promineifilaceae bacterium]